VVSTGRRNTLAKSLSWRLEVRRFPGPLVELSRNFVQLGLRVCREIKAFGEVPAQQAVGVFVLNRVAMGFADRRSRRRFLFPC
jgi:hypothetical protein